MASEDSVEAFLAREHQQLADLDDDFGNLSAGQNGQLNGFSDTVTNGDITAEEPAPAAPMTLSALPPQQQAAMRQAATPTPPLTQMREEPEKIKKWREQQKDRLEKKDNQEDKEKQKWREQAKHDLDEWNKNYKEQLEKTKKNNRLSEQDFISERDAVQPGQEWERITRLCEFNPKSSKNTKDVSRYRSLLLQLKNQPVKQ